MSAFYGYGGDRRGGDALSVAAVMGHAQPSMTLDVYGGTDADAMAAAMVGVDEALSHARARHAASQSRAS